MKKISMVGLFMLLGLTACTTFMYGVPQESWDRMSESERLQAMQQYERNQQANRQAYEERARTRAIEDQARRQAQEERARYEAREREESQAVQARQAIDQRIARDFELIEEGVRSGSLPRPESHRLKDQLKNVRDDEARMLRDGRLDANERQRLGSELDRVERQINSFKTAVVPRHEDRRNEDRGREDRGREERRAVAPSTAKISVVSGTYGANCGQKSGNVTRYLAAQCNGQKQCNYKIDYKVIGDPAVGCGKTYVAQWRCGNDPIQSVTAPAEAGYGSVISLFCK